MTTDVMTGQAIRTAAAGRAWATGLRLGGALLSLAGGIILMGIITAESFYPRAYSTGANQISDLGGTEPPNSLVFQPSAGVFDGSMIVVGLLVLAGSWLIHREIRRRAVSIPLALLGVGAFGVGLFPGNTGTPHALFAMLTFVAGGVAALTGSRVTTAPFRYLSILLGAISILSLVSYLALRDASPMVGLGIGGIERWIVYPIVIWVTAFGGFLAGRADAGSAGASLARP